MSQEQVEKIREQIYYVPTSQATAASKRTVSEKELLERAKLIKKTFNFEDFTPSDSISSRPA